MIKVICDGCGKVLDDKGKNVVNVNFNHYTLPKGRMKLIGDEEVNLCLACAEDVQKFIADMMAENRKFQNIVENN